MTRADIISLIKQFTGQQNMLSIPRIFVKLTGDANSAILLSQILYWSDRTADPDKWFYKSAEEWEEEIGLSRYQVKRCANALAGLGIETKLKKAKGAPTTHYRINYEVFEVAFLKFLENRESDKSVLQETSKSELQETCKSITKTTKDYITKEESAMPKVIAPEPTTNVVSPKPQTPDRSFYVALENGTFQGPMTLNAASKKGGRVVQEESLPSLAQIVSPNPAFASDVKNALAIMCYGNTNAWAVKSNATNMGKTLREIGEAGEVTVELLRTFYRNWKDQDFRGQKGQMPTPSQVREFWITYTTSKPQTIEPAKKTDPSKPKMTLEEAKAHYLGRKS